MDQNNLRVSGLRDSPKLHRDLAIKKKKKKKKSQVDQTIHQTFVTWKGNYFNCLCR
jgi:hypothetical protein